jgi:hypothetical protein
MSSLSLLQIIAKSKSPNFQILKQAYLYGLIFNFLEEYFLKKISQSIPFKLNLKFEKKAIVIEIKSSITYLTNLVVMEQDDVKTKLFNFLLKKKIVKTIEQIELKL